MGIRVLVVDDSPVAREFLTYVLMLDPGIEVVATAVDGVEAVDLVRRHQPAVVTMDVHMPRMNGLDATRAIMETHPVPIVIVSGTTTARELAGTFRAMEVGAVAVVRRPTALGHPEHAETASELVQTVKLMAEVKVVRRWPRHRRGAPPAAAPPGVEPAPGPPVRIVAVGASTGGPIVLQSILSMLPATFPIPVLIVQHIAPGFVEGLAEWLTGSTGFPVHVARNGETPLPGRAYLAPDRHHLKISADGRLLLGGEEPENGVRPAVSVLFRSVAEVFGPATVGVLLTGMGEDGASELKLLRDRGAVTIAQDEETSVVHGMPGEAIRRQAAAYVLPAEAIGQTLQELVRRRR